jgi:ABC-type dipeptide/oligopeptide/nickel transport system ATPase component
LPLGTALDTIKTGAGARESFGAVGIVSAMTQSRLTPMAWIEPVAAAVAAAELAAKVAESSTFLKKHWKRLKYLASRGKISIAILGAGGSGKSTVAKIITGKVDPFHLDSIYRQSITLDQEELQGDVPGNVDVVPGQLLYDEKTKHFTVQYDNPWETILRNIEYDKYLGIINVVNYGYHTFSDFSSFTKTDLGKGRTLEEFIAAYTDWRRSAELQLLDLLLSSLVKIRRSTWLITLVCKQDLWWFERDRVRAYYDSGEYHNKVRGVQNELKSRNVYLQHEMIPASLIISNLRSEEETLASNSAGYDTQTHIRYLNQFLEYLTTLVSHGPRRE